MREAGGARGAMGERGERGEMWGGGELGALLARFIGLFHGVDVRKCLPGLNSKKVVEVGIS